MNLMFMSNNKIPSGATAIYLLSEGAGQVATDRSGHGNHGRLGSTSGADTNDPVWTGGGVVFAGDDYIYLPPFIDVTKDFSIYVCAVVAPSAPAANETYFSLGHTVGTNQYLALQRSTSGRLALSLSNDVGAAIYPYIDAAQVVPGVRLLVAKRQAGNIFVKDVAANIKGVAEASPATPMTFNQAALGCTLKTTGFSFLNRAIYGSAFFNRATTDAEDQMMRRFFSARKGIAI